MNSYQMMLGVNFFSAILTVLWLVVQNPQELARSMSFLIDCPEAQLHVFVLAVCNAFGQLFIYYTISKYGALVFTMIMTTRQVFSIGVSVAVFGHKVRPPVIGWMMFVEGVVRGDGAKRNGRAAFSFNKKLSCSPGKRNCSHAQHLIVAFFFYYFFSYVHF